MAIDSDTASEQAELFCLFTYWLTGRLSLEQAKIVRQDLARPDSRIYATISSLDQAACALLADPTKAMTVSRSGPRRE